MSYEAERAVAAAQNLVELRRWQQALDTLGPALASEDTACEAHCLASICLARLGKSESALKAVAVALGIDPHDSWAHMLRGIWLLDLQRRAAALDEAQEAVRLEPRWPNALYNLARCQLSLCRYDDAHDTAVTAVESNPNDPLTHYLTGLVADRQLPRSERVGGSLADWDAAEHGYRSALALDPADTDAAQGLASVVQRRDRPFEALRIYLAIARADPTQGAWAAIESLLERVSDTRHRWQGLEPACFTRYLGNSAITAELTRLEAAVDDHIAAVDRAWEKSQQLLIEAVAAAFPEKRSSLKYHFLYHRAGFSGLPSADYEIPRYPLPWQTLELDGDPIPARLSRHRVEYTINECQHATEALAEHDQQLWSLTAMGGEIALPYDEASFQEVLLDVHPQLNKITEIYRSCARVLTDYSDGLWLADEQLSTAVHWAEHTHEQLQSEPESAWAQERRAAITLAEEAVETFRSAERQCIDRLQRLVSNPDEFPGIDPAHQLPPQDSPDTIAANPASPQQQHPARLLAAGKRAAALQEAQHRAVLEPDSATVLYALARSQFAVFRWGPARETARRALATNPPEPLAHQLTALVADCALLSHEPADGDCVWDTAEQAYRQAMEAVPDQGSALGLASVLRRRGCDFEALHLYLKTAASNPHDKRIRSTVQSVFDEAVILHSKWEYVRSVEFDRYLGSPNVSAVLQRLQELLTGHQNAVDEAWLASVSKLWDEMRALWRAYDDEPLEDEYPDWGLDKSMFKDLGLDKPEPTEPEDSAQWYLLNYDDNPVPARRDAIQDVADQCDRMAVTIAATAKRLRGLLGGDPSSRATDRDDRDFYQILVGIAARLATIIDIYGRCATILTTYADCLRQVDNKLSTALEWAHVARSRLAAYSRLTAHELDDWEIEHLQAIALADDAVEVFSAAEASCIEALQELVRPESAESDPPTNKRT